MRVFFHSIIVTLILGLATSLQATVTIDFTAAVALRHSGALVEDGTLWALIVDNGDNDILGMDVSGDGESLTSSGTANTYFSINQEVKIGKNVSGGDVGDLIFAIGGFDFSVIDEGGTTNHVLSLAIGGEEGALIAANRKYAFLWFPGATYEGATTATGAFANIGGEVGGISSQVNDGDLGAMFVPGSGTVPQGALSSDSGGVWNPSDFTADTLIPEPSSALLAVFGSLLLLRRRRSA